MSQFEFFMTFYGLLLGLALAELLLGFANVLRSPERPGIGLLTPLLGVTVFLQIMATFIDAWTRLQSVRMTIDSLALPTLIGVGLFFLGVIAVPRDASQWRNLDDYFYANRRWSIGLLIAVNVLILGYEAPYVRQLLVDGHCLNLGYYLVVNLIFFGTLAGALLLRARLAVAAALGLCILLYLYIFSGFSLLIFPAAGA